MVRASKYDKPVVSAAVLEGMLVQHLSCFKACQAAGVPITTFMDWINDDKELSERYARARESLIEHIASEIMEISDESGNDTYVDAKGNVRTDHEVVARSRLRVDTRKWLLSKLAPKKYGDKVEVDHSGSVQIDQITRKVVDPLTIENNVTGSVLKALELKKAAEAAEDIENYKDIEDL